MFEVILKAIGVVRERAGMDTELAIVVVHAVLIFI